MSHNRGHSGSPSRLSGRGQGRSSSRCQSDGTSTPVSYPNIPYSFSNPPPFSGSLQWPTFNMGSHIGAYTYFSMVFDDDLLHHLVDQTDLYARLHPFG